MSVSYKKLFHLLIVRGIQPSEIAEMSGFSANIMTRIKRNQYISLNCTVDEIIEFRKEIEDSDEEIQ